MRTIPAIPLRLLASVVLGIVLAIPANPPALFAQGTCPGHGAAPTPAEVTVTAVPIVVASTTADYFVLYVKHDVDGGTLEQPVAVVLGEAGTTTLAENVEALAAERYKVEKYLVADPADVDGDCVDDISELADPAGMNPVNPAAAIDISSGAVIIPDRVTLDTLATDFGGGKHMKFIVFGMNTERMGIYFMNAKLVAHHYLFVNSVGLSDEDTIRGNISYDPELLGPGGSAGLYYFWTTLNRSESEYYSFDFAARVYALLAASMPMVNDNLALYIQSKDVAGYQPHLPVYRQSRIDLRFREDIHGVDSFRILNPGKAVGRLRVLEPDDLPHPRDIVIYGALPNELPRVAGVISTVPQTPLSHVNLRAIQNGMPNSYFRDALDDPTVNSLRGKYVHYVVSADGAWSISAATAEEVDAHYAASRPANTQTPQRDLSVTSITALGEVSFEDWSAFGVKAANLAVLRTLGFPSGTVPDGFAIPFYFYDEFMKHNDFYTRIRAMLADTDFQTDFDVQERQLKSLRKAIEDAPTPDWIIAAIETMNESFPDDINKRYRSSTNNEDLPGFNGAGLYDSKSQKPSEDEEDLAKSLKEVYASLWNFRAFSEREFNRIDHMSTAMGILVHPSYQDELANGVAVSFSPYDPLDEATFYVNAQAEEVLVTNPPAHSLPEEILLTAGGNINVLGLSNKVAPGQLLMTKAQRAQLHTHLQTIHDHFKALYNPAAHERFAMEIEFKITSENILAIKQARPWVFATARTSPPSSPIVVAAPAIVGSGVNEAPVVSGETDIEYAEDRTDAVARYSATDPDRGASITWSLLGDDAAIFAISRDGVLTFAAPPDYETAAGAGPDNAYLITVVASDGSLEASLAVSVTITDVNEPPTLSGPFSVFVPEHLGLSVTRYGATDPDRGARLAWILGGHDEDVFQISSDGKLEFRAVPDFEHPLDRDHDNVYRLSVWVSDGRNTRSIEVFVTVTNIDEPGVISFSSLQPQIGTEINASLSDPDGGTTGLTWQWQISDNGIAWSDGGAISADYMPVAADEGKLLRVSVRYSDAEGSLKSAVAELRAVRRPPDLNEAPAFPGSESGERSVRENTLAGESIGAPIAADDDPGDVLTYSLDPTGDVVFDIVPESGQLLTERPLDYEYRSSYTVTVTATDSFRAVATLLVTITVEPVDEPPDLAGATVISVVESSTGPVTTYSAVDPEVADLTWSLGGQDQDAFALVSGVLSFLTPPAFDSTSNLAGANTYELTVAVSDGTHTASLDVTVIVTDVDESASGPSPVIRGPISIGGGGGGGGPSGPTPSDVDFEWTVKRDVEALDPGNDWPTGLWSDGRVLWIAENGSGADDEVYAYDLKSGERLEQRELELAEANRAPRGFWSDGETVWVSDSGQDRLFAYDLESGERLEQREFELAERNRDARAIWSDGMTIWVLDGGKDSLFAYDLASGELLAEYALDDANGDPHGLWSDGVSVWVSDHGAKRLFAYRLPVLDGDAVEDEQAQPLERVREEEFKELSKASNNSPRGLWSDGAVMYVADESDDKVYSYNMPDALDARLASLTLSGVDIGEFDPSRTEYEGTVTAGVTVTTVGAEAAQRGATVAVAPVDADADTEGHQLAITDGAEIMVTVTSSDGSRRKVYRVRIGEAGPSASCLRGAVTVGFSLVVSEGGSIEELVACAESRNVTALYAIEAGEYVSYVTGAPDLVNARFRGLFAGGVPALTPLLTRSAGPASAAPDAPAVTDPLPACLVGEIAEGFNLALYEGGSVDDLAACVQSHNVTAVYTLHEGEYVSYILGAPELVNRSFRELFADGLAPATPLVAKRD